MDELQLYDKISREFASKIESLEEDILSGSPATELKYRQLVARLAAFQEAKELVKTIFSRARTDEVTDDD